MWKTTNYKGDEEIWYRRNEMDAMETILVLIKELIVLCLVVILTIGIFKVSKKLDRLIELNTPEFVSVIPDNVLLEE